MVDISSDFQTPQNWLKELGFFNPHLGVWKSDEKHFLVFDILHSKTEAYLLMVEDFPGI